MEPLTTNILVLMYFGDAIFGGRSGIAPDELQSAFDACIGTGDAAQSPVLRLVRKLAPELLNTNQNQEEYIPRKPNER
jgi:hypothetical protein